MKSYEIRLTKEAKKDIIKLTPKLREKLKTILTETIVSNPFVGKKLSGDLEDFYSFRLTRKDRIVYTIDSQERIIYIHRTKTHYGD